MNELCLQAGDASLLLLPEYGGLVNGLMLATPVGPREVIAPVATAGLPDNPGYRGTVLFPFPNRLRDGCYCLNGTGYQFAVNEETTHTALHGVLYRHPAKVAASEQGENESRATLVWETESLDSAYPFHCRISMEYRLHAQDGLTVSVVIDNLDQQEIPVGFGWHPYFTLSGQVNDWQLLLPEVRRQLVDERMLPVGEPVTDTRFATPALIGATQFDECFELQAKDAEQAVTVYSPAAGFGLAVWQQAGPQGMNFVQLYTPPDRASLAIEPMSCGIDALNTGAGLVCLAPGESYRGTYGVRAVNL